MEGFGIELEQSPIAFGPVFPDLEEELRKFSEFKQVMRNVGAPDTMQRYRTPVDYLFSEFFDGAWPMRCVRFYEEKGPSLSEVLSPGEIGRSQWILLLAVKLAFNCALQKKRVHWCRFRSEVLNFALAQGVQKPTSKRPTIRKESATKPSVLVVLAGDSVNKSSAEVVRIESVKQPARRRPLR